MDTIGWRARRYRLIALRESLRVLTRSLALRQGTAVDDDGQRRKAVCTEVKALVVSESVLLTHSFKKIGNLRRGGWCNLIVGIQRLVVVSADRIARGTVRGSHVAPWPGS